MHAADLHLPHVGDPGQPLYYAARVVLAFLFTFATIVAYSELLDEAVAPWFFVFAWFGTVVAVHARALRSTEFIPTVSVIAKSGFTAVMFSAVPTCLFLLEKIGGIAPGVVGREMVVGTVLLIAAVAYWWLYVLAAGVAINFRRGGASRQSTPVHSLRASSSASAVERARKRVRKRG